MSIFLKATGVLTVAVGIGAYIIASSVQADDCTDTINMVSEAASTAGLGQADLDKVSAAKADAMNKQAAGDVEGCLASLSETKAMLNLQ